ncbi:MAG: hypothetical protein GX142_00280, partial [Chloroflexi bacterium]|nr:hypothetical protein [Chloroflexota bacterium]
MMKNDKQVKLRSFFTLFFVSIFMLAFLALLPGEAKAAPGQVEHIDGEFSSQPNAFPDFYMRVNPQKNTIYSPGWPRNSQVAIKINKSRVQTVQASNYGVVDVTLTYDIQAGDEIELSTLFGSQHLKHIVEIIEITELNISNNTVSGKAEAGKTVQLTICAKSGNGPPYALNCIWPTIELGDSEENWSADFTDLVFGKPDVNEVSISAEVKDAQGNSTIASTRSDYHYHVEPNRTITVYPQTGRIVSYGWPENADVFLEIDGSGPETVTADDDGMVDVTLGENVIHGGTELKMYTLGSTTALEYTVENLGINGSNFHTNTVSGTADQGKQVSLSVFARGNIPGSPGMFIEDWIRTTITVGDTETWSFDFSSLIEGFPVPVEEIYVYSRIEDSHGNATVVD